MKLIWSPQAIEDLSELRRYISSDNPHTAQRLARRIVGVAESVLSWHPEAGRPGRVSDTRELVVPHTPYIIPYRVRGGTVEILRVYHGARKWPERF